MTCKLHMAFLAKPFLDTKTTKSSAWSLARAGQMLGASVRQIKPASGSQLGPGMRLRLRWETVTSAVMRWSRSSGRKSSPMLLPASEHDVPMSSVAKHNEDTVTVSPSIPRLACCTSSPAGRPKPFDPAFSFSSAEHCGLTAQS